jgi:glycosyltransferase involved in cell wall biosynthesis
MGPTASVIIPTYNRKRFLHQTLASLAQQSCPPDCFEVIVVDDGSKDGTEQVARDQFPFPLHYLWQANKGDAAARNTGAAASEAEFLVFVDDDIVLAPDFLRLLLAAHGDERKRIVVGTSILWLEDNDPPLATQREEREQPPVPTVPIPFVDVCSNNMSLRREAYAAVGGMEGLGFSGSSIWCDVDFSYRAQKLGFTFHRSRYAICWHQDYTERSLQTRMQRNYKVAYRAVALFKKYPELVRDLPMFADMTPVQWGQDNPGLVARKLLRAFASSPPVLWSLAQAAVLLESRSAAATLVRPLQRWVIGGYIYRGFRQGRRELAGVAS